MRSVSEIRSLLEELEQQPANALEDQDLDFKEWIPRSMKDSVALVVEMAICMANGGGGTVVFGINEKATGRARAILGVPPEVDVNRLKKAVYDSTDPKLTPVFEGLLVPEGTGRVLVMQIYPGIPPYTDTAGRGKVHIGKDCQPLTGTLRRRIMVETGETDFTATEISGRLESLISASAMERLRQSAARERAPDDLLRESDRNLLGAIGLIRKGRFLRAGLLLAGTTEAIREHFQGYAWTHLRMATDTDYSDRADGQDAIPLAMERIIDRIMADNPIATVPQGLFHFEIRTYPEIALREAVLNALVHADYRIHGPILLKQFKDRLEISNPGGLPGGITPENILRHEPVPRNPTLVDALTRLRLVNRSNLGVRRMYQALLIEGKEPPSILDEGEAVRVIFRASELSVPFRMFVADESNRGRILSVEHLLIVQHLLRHPEIDTATAARITQQTESDARETLSLMETEFGDIERGGTGRGTYWTLRHDLHRKLSVPGHPERDRRIDWEAAKTRVLSVLMERSRHGEVGLSNAEIRQIARMDRFQVIRLMKELMAENPNIQKPGRGRNARYVIPKKPKKM
ncbi:MAG: putative DNA binding domain-containing protein [Deltaproteobacteria bacterium]|nr:putative DNA binding domain-containing protein [Deltaproteobacteria bacterium]